MPCSCFTRCHVDKKKKKQSEGNIHTLTSLCYCRECHNEIDTNLAWHEGEFAFYF